MQSVKGLSMETRMCWAAIGVAGVLLILFILDLAMDIPFGGISGTVDILGIVCCAILGYLAWDALRDLK